mgnify:CR=1 FL=1
MNPDQIELDNLSKNFEYERISREIDSCENIEQVKNIILKSSIDLVVTTECMGIIFIKILLGR